MNPTNRSKRLMRTRESAEYMSVSLWQLRKLVQDGRLPVVQHEDGGKFLFDVRDLDAYIERNKRTVPA